MLYSTRCSNSAIGPQKIGQSGGKQFGLDANFKAMEFRLMPKGMTGIGLGPMSRVHASRVSLSTAGTYDRQQLLELQPVFGDRAGIGKHTHLRKQC